MDTLMITKYNYRMAVHPANKWGGTEISKSLLEHWSLLTLDHIADFQRDTMDY